MARGTGGALVVALGLLITVTRPGQVVTELVFVAVIVLVRQLLLLPIVRRSGLTVRSSIETSSRKLTSTPEVP